MVANGHLQKDDTRDAKDLVLAGRPMKACAPAASPDAYIAALSGWQKPLVETLRRAAVSAATLDERIKWGNLVYLSNGPVLLIRAEPMRVLLGFWRGQRLRAMDDRLRPSGKYELANIVLKPDDSVSEAAIRRLVKAAVQLNLDLGDPTRLPS